MFSVRSGLINGQYDTGGGKEGERVSPWQQFLRNHAHIEVSGGGGGGVSLISCITTFSGGNRFGGVCVAFVGSPSGRMSNFGRT